MDFPKEECVLLTWVLSRAKNALLEKNSAELKELSNLVVSSACNYQDSENITLSVTLYALSKLIERADYSRIPRWNFFVKKFNAALNLAARALDKGNQNAYDKSIGQARRELTSQSINIKPYIQEVLKKASINKGFRLYEHGISLEQTAKLLGVSRWELAEYIGEKTSAENLHGETISIKKRAKMALEFFG
jgi:AraC-like DNA-binding protein